MSRTLRTLFVATLLAGCHGAGSNPPAATTTEPAQLAPQPDPVAPRADAAAAAGAVLEEPALPPEPEPPAGDPVVAVLDPAVLVELERAGHDVATRLGLAGPVASTRALQASPVFATVTRTVADDLDELYGGDAKAGVGMGHAHRLFDADWLDAETTRLELVGVVARFDRRPFARSPGACGELRFVYRLAYTVEVEGLEVDSRLPMTLNVASRLEPADGGDCAALARAWLREGPADAAWLLADDGPLAAARLAPERLDKVELNVQSVRWPSTVHPKMAGHAEYLIRTFRAVDGGAAVEPAPLENTPDVERLAADPALRQALLDWLSDPHTLAAIDAGTALMPEHLAATRAVSVAPRGLARLANRPWRQLLEPDALAELALADHPRIASPRALLRRLDTMSCTGCHHGRSVAGFHLLGHERDASVDIDALASAVSPHFAAEQGWRGAIVEAMALGRFDAVGAQSYGDAGARPLAERASGGWGERCGLGDAGFADWTCADGLVCRALEDEELGVCVPEARGVGDPCEHGTMRMRADPREDRVRDLVEHACADGAFCEANSVGFPGGMCASSCAGAGDDGVCGGIPALTDFNRCLARKVPFRTCIAETVRPRALRGCDSDHACRDDYVCAKVAGESRGACLPPYFLFQLRVDGHPL